MHYIIGLGNPGEKYARTRHNVGRLALEYIAKETGVTGWAKDKHANALQTAVVIGGESVACLLPETYMNQSGQTVKYLIDKHGATPPDCIVVHDDIDLPFGTIKIVQGRGAGGNNGIASIIKSIGSKDIVRIRVGIAPTSFWTGKVKRPAGGGPLERFVLQPFSRSEEKSLPELFGRVQSALQVIVAEGPEVAMNTYNT